MSPTELVKKGKYALPIYIFFLGGGELGRISSMAPLLPTISEVVNSSKLNIEQRIWISGETGIVIVMAFIDKLNSYMTGVCF